MIHTKTWEKVKSDRWLSMGIINNMEESGNPNGILTDPPCAGTNWFSSPEV